MQDLSCYLDERHIRRMRNPHKRAYALAMLAWLRGERIGPEPDRGKLSLYCAMTLAHFMCCAWTRQQEERTH